MSLNTPEMSPNSMSCLIGRPLYLVFSFRIGRDVDKPLERFACNELAKRDRLNIAFYKTGKFSVNLER